MLRLLSGTLSLREIGEQLYVSQNTIKTHARAIYRKLGVSTRHDAITRARTPGSCNATPPGQSGAGVSLAVLPVVPRCR